MVGNHLFVIFAVLDVSCAVNSCINHSFFYIYLSIRRGRATTLHTHHQVSLMVSRNTTIVPSLGLHIGPACEADLSAGMQRKRKKERRTLWKTVVVIASALFVVTNFVGIMENFSPFATISNFTQSPVVVTLANLWCHWSTL